MSKLFMISSLNYVLGRLEGLAVSCEAEVQRGILDTCSFVSDLIDTLEAEESEGDNGQTTVLTAADVAPVRHGHYMWHAGDNDYECSVCHVRCVNPLETCCPFCGARMDESEGDNG